MTFENWVGRLEDRVELHAKLVNTFSFLEYIGARKILKSQKSESVSVRILIHLAEEIRHAQMLKRLALKMSDGALCSYREEHLLAGREANIYIQAVDQSVSAALGDSNPFLSYLYTTLLIEERAEQVYPKYEAVLESIGFGGVLKGIIREEERHLQEVQDEIQNRVGLGTPDAGLMNYSGKLFELRQLEGAAFGRFMATAESTHSSPPAR